MDIILIGQFHQKGIAQAHRKRIKNIDIDLMEYNKMKKADPEFYQDASNLQYGKVKTFVS